MNIMDRTEREKQNATIRKWVYDFKTEYNRIPTYEEFSEKFTGMNRYSYSGFVNSRGRDKSMRVWCITEQYPDEYFSIHTEYNHDEFEQAKSDLIEFIEENIAENVGEFELDDTDKKKISEILNKAIQEIKKMQVFKEYVYSVNVCKDHHPIFTVDEETRELKQA